MPHSASLKMRKARSELVLEHPFFATLALRLELREDATCRTAWSDGRVLAYNPHYIEALPLEKVKGLQCHEVLHLACCHHTRRGGRDKTLWNKACDLAINHILLDAGIELPTGFLDDPAHHGKTAEAIYAALTDHDEERKGGATGGPQQEVQAEEDMAGNGAGELSQDDAGRSEPDGNEAEDDDIARAEEGAGSQGDEDNEHGEDRESDDPGLSGEVRDAPSTANGMDGAQALRLEEDSWRVAAAQALHKAQEAGDLPGSLERLILGSLAPSVSWREILRRFLAEAARNDFTWIRPNRRHLHEGLYLPGLESQELAEVAVAVDVSGSITQPELDAFAAELSAILEEFDTAITVFTCDAWLTTEARLARWDLPLAFEAKGGGGTDFRPPFARLDESGISPACFIYFTDLACNCYPAEPDYPVLWVTPASNPAPPPFGEVAMMRAA
ncbi:vWA domain-containing protein [Megalodesulfovibrio paquesii]